MIFVSGTDPVPQLSGTFNVWRVYCVSSVKGLAGTSSWTMYGELARSEVCPGCLCRLAVKKSRDPKSKMRRRISRAVGWKGGMLAVQGELTDSQFRQRNLQRQIGQAGAGSGEFRTLRGLWR